MYVNLLDRWRANQIIYSSPLSRTQKYARANTIYLYEHLLTSYH